MTLARAEPQELGLCPRRSAALLETLQSEVDRQRLPGAVVAVARHGRLAIFDSLGCLNPATAAPMPTDALFRLYSMTKPVVSVAAMMLMEQGRFLLSDPVERYLPEFGHARVAVEQEGRVTLLPARRPITVHDLLRHTAGLTYEFSGQSAVQSAYHARQLHVRMPGRDLAAYVRTLASVPLMDQPGSVGEYSRATDVVGRLVEVLAGQSLGQFLAQRIFEPLGMRDTAFFVPASQQHRIAEPFAADPEGAPLMTMSDIRQPPAMESGGGGLVSTAQDYARFLQCLLGGGQLGDARLLGPRTVDFMVSDHLGGIPARDNLLEPGEGFGLGFAVRMARGVVPVPGSVGTYYWSGLGGTSFFVDPAEDLLALLLIQAPNQRAYYRQLFRNLVYACLVD